MRVSLCCCSEHGYTHSGTVLCTIHSVLLYHMHHNMPTKKTSRSTGAVGQHGEDGRQPDKLQCPTILKYRTVVGMQRCRPCTSSYSGPHRRLWRRPNAKLAQYPATSSQLQAQQQPNQWDIFNHPSWTSRRPLRWCRDSLKHRFSSAPSSSPPLPAPPRARAHCIRLQCSL